MSISLKSVLKTLSSALVATALLALSLAAAAESPQAEPSARGMVLTMEAEVTEIDLETRQVSLRGPTGNIVTVTSPEKVVKLEDVSVGDIVTVTYVAALEGELRAPTEEELAEPWKEVDKAGTSTDADHPAAGEARVIRAVTTVEGMNRALGTVTLKDPRGKLHLIGDVEPEKMEGVKLGDTVVVIYTEALAISLEKKPQAE